MTTDPRAFWRHFQTSLRVAVAASGRLPDKLAGVRDGFRRYFHEAHGMPVTIETIASLADDEASLPMTDDEILGLARRRAEALAATGRDATRGETADFVVGSESGLLPVACGAEVRHVVRTWTVIFGPAGEEAWGSSGSLQLPQRLLEDLDLAGVVPGRRRAGGMVSSLTFGLDTRRQATEASTLNALSSLLYGVLDHPQPDS